MKKSFIYFILITAIFTSCKKSEEMSISEDESQVDMTVIDAPADEINNNEDYDNIYQEPSHPCPECDITITPNEYDKISDEQYEKLKSSGFNYSKVTWKLPGILGYWYVSSDCDVSFIKKNDSEGPFCKRCAESYCEKRSQAEKEETQYLEQEQSQQETRREYRICDWCGKEVVGQIYSIRFGKEVEKGPIYDCGIYHQNCGYEYLNTKGR